MRISVQEYAAAFAEPIVKISVNALVTLTRWMNDAFMASRSLYLEDARIVASVFVPAMTFDGSPLDPQVRIRQLTRTRAMAPRSWCFHRRCWL